MKFNFFFYLWAILLVVCTGCGDIDNDLHSSSPKNHESEQTRAEIFDESDFRSTLKERRAIAQWLSKNATLEDIEVIHRAVEKAVDHGLDEVCFLSEFISANPSVNKIFREKSSTISQAFRAESFSNEKGSQPEPIIGIINNNEYLQIYWPYSDDWDHQTMPVVAYAPEDINATSGTGFRSASTKIESVTIDEEYCKTHPVLIINESEVGYSEIPNFSNGEQMSANGVFYSPRNIDAISNASDNSTVRTVYLGKIKATKHYDGLFGGGSEFIFTIGRLSNTDLTCVEDTTLCQPIICKIKKDVRRRDKDKWVDVHSIAVSDWQKNLNNVAFLVVEEDGGKEDKSKDFKLNVEWESHKYNFDVSLKYKHKDDFIGEKTYLRSFIFSTLNNLGDKNWHEDTSGSLYWTLPYAEGTTLY